MEGVKTNFKMFNWFYGFICVLGIISTSYGDGETRQVSPPNVNPGCPKNSDSCSNPWLVHVTADGENTTLHHLWGTVGSPTYMFALTEKETSITVDWTNFMKAEAGSVTFSNTTEVDYAFGLAIVNMILVNDVNDTGKIDNIPEKDRKYVPMSDFTWNITEVLNSSASEKGIVCETIAYQGEPMTDDKIVLKILAMGKDGRRSALPHLITTPDSAQLSITLDNLVFNITNLVKNEGATPPPISGFTKPRWALDVVIFSMEDRDDIEETFKYHTVKSLDDEYSPGVFNIDDITTNLSRASKTGGYVQWRPVSYLTKDLDVTYSTIPNFDTSFPELDSLEGSLSKSLAYAVFGDNLINRMVSTKTTVLFGQSKDKFYTEYKYTTWTLAYGLGSPPEESFSNMVIIIISLGSGIPVLVFLAGGIFVGYRKIRGN